MAENLSPNDDLLERAQARAARAAANRRRSLSINAPPPSAAEFDQCLSKQQILELFQNCIKLASENKINQKNTWELNLIDHLCDIIKVEEEEEDVETNFQKASCTLEAGVKIYSLRVDYVHSEAYKVLGGINRAGHEDEQDDTLENSDKVEQGEGSCKEFKKISPTSTLESSFEAFNVKKFDVAFAVDPLYHQTSAQFDEGGAKGLLLNNLGVYGSCRVLFDSSEIPAECITSTSQLDNDDLVDLTFAREYAEQMVLNMQKINEISPTLRSIVYQFDDDNKRPEINQFADYQLSQMSVEQAESSSHDEADMCGNAYDDCEAWNVDHGDGTSTVDEGHNGADADLPEHYEGNEHLGLHVRDIDDRFDKVDGCLFLSLGFTSKKNAWAGPDHWKYRKAKGSEEVEPETANGSRVPAKKSRTRKKVEADIDFSTALNTDFSDIFLPPKNSKSLLLPENRAACNTKLPEDCHYQPENLVKLFLLPNVVCLGKRRKLPDMAMGQNNMDSGDLPSWEDEHVFDGSFDDDGNVNSDDEESSTLVSQPRQVNKVEVQYDKTSKQVDVQALKEVLWERMKRSSAIPSQNGEEEVVSFKDVLAGFPSDCTAASVVEHVSPHLCFICLLHLANEHGLSLHGSATLDDLAVHLHPSMEAISTK